MYYTTNTHLIIVRVTKNRLKIVLGIDFTTQIAIFVAKIRKSYRVKNASREAVDTEFHTTSFPAFPPTIGSMHGLYCIVLRLQALKRQNLGIFGYHPKVSSRTNMYINI